METRRRKLEDSTARSKKKHKSRKSKEVCSNAVVQDPVSFPNHAWSHRTDEQLLLLITKNLACLSSDEWKSLVFEEGWKKIFWFNGGGMAALLGCTLAGASIGKDLLVQESAFFYETPLSCWTAETFPASVWNACWKWVRREFFEALHSQQQLRAYINAHPDLVPRFREFNVRSYRCFKTLLARGVVETTFLTHLSWTLNRNCFSTYRFGTTAANGVFVEQVAGPGMFEFNGNAGGRLLQPAHVDGEVSDDWMTPGWHDLCLRNGVGKIVKYMRLLEVLEQLGPFIAFGYIFSVVETDILTHERNLVKKPIAQVISVPTVVLIDLDVTAFWSPDYLALLDSEWVEGQLAAKAKAKSDCFFDGCFETGGK